jgi:hypothetical protein
MSYSVLVRWQGKAPFNNTIDSHCGITKQEADAIADLYASNEKAKKVEIIHCVNDITTSKTIKGDGYGCGYN